MNKAAELKKTEGNKLIKLEAEMAKLNEQIGLEKEEEKLASLQERELRLRKDLAELLATGKESEKLEKALRQATDDTWIQQKKVERLRGGRDEAVENLKLQVMAKYRAHVEEFLPEAFERVSALKEKLLVEAKDLVTAYEVYQRNIPRRWEQISSKRFIRLERERSKGKMEFFGSMHHSDDKEVNHCELFKVPLFLAAGWKVFPIDQDLTPEPLNNNNSTRVNAVSIPEVINSVVDRVFFQMNFSDIAGMITEEDILNFQKEIERAK